MARNLSHRNHKRLCIQGYGRYTGAQLADLRFGIRFPYVLGAIIMSIGVALQNTPTLVIMMAIAALGVLLPYNPFDYLYNHVVRDFVRRPLLPPRTPQAKFAYAMATLWLLAVVILFSTGHILAGKILGWILVGVAALVASTDICIPSMIYNLIKERQLVPKA